MKYKLGSRFSSEMNGFIQSCLVLDPSKRATSRSLLSHSYVLSVFVGVEWSAVNEPVCVPRCGPRVRASVCMPVFFVRFRCVGVSCGTGKVSWRLCRVRHTCRVTAVWMLGGGVVRPPCRFRRTAGCCEAPRVSLFPVATASVFVAVASRASPVLSFVLVCWV